MADFLLAIVGGIVVVAGPAFAFYLARQYSGLLTLFYRFAALILFILGLALAWKAFLVGTIFALIAGVVFIFFFDFQTNRHSDLGDREKTELDQIATEVKKASRKSLD